MRDDEVLLHVDEVLWARRTYLAEVCDQLLLNHLQEATHRHALTHLDGFAVTGSVPIRIHHLQ